MVERPTERLTTQQVADLLGVKVETVYAYASRGQLSSERLPGGKGSTFDAAEVAELAARGRRPPRQSPHEPVTVRTALTLIEDGRLYFRGTDAIRLAREHGFEAAVGWLWGLGTTPGVALRSPAGLAPLLARTAESLPPRTRLTDRLRIAVAVAGTADPSRFDLREESVRASGAALIGTMVEALPRRTPEGAEYPQTTLAARLWGRLAPDIPSPAALRCLDLALVLMMDHDLAVSTVAARVAASARAHPYAVVSAGLGALDGPLHGAIGSLAHALLIDVINSGNATDVVSFHHRTGRDIPGLGARMYPNGDPRAAELLSAMRELPLAAEVLVALEAVVDAASGPGTRQYPSIDLALAAFALATGMPGEAGEVIVAVARTAGWLAHAMEEYQEEPLRMRARGVYTGPRPAAD
ncbi:citrate synthase [Streptomyces tateyamensis]|uniref:citrate synthase (unknown stereospecificity) n=1 Tax=Streptomyces tateyamensis TaxID=565073 RepID=A0A2V4NCS4_9ACTN|nr:citrate synthase [Streptomyces tateyamensis]PYC79514.1 citrate synthase [Streptomyces tateyamensis]